MITLSEFEAVGRAVSLYTTYSQNEKGFTGADRPILQRYLRQIMDMEGPGLNVVKRPVNTTNVRLDRAKKQYIQFSERGKVC